MVVADNLKIEKYEKLNQHRIGQNDSNDFD